jgi:hypothetical protein
VASQTCPRCSKDFTQADRFCSRCGQLLVGGSFMLATGEAMEAAQREREWLDQTPPAVDTITVPAGAKPERVERSVAGAADAQEPPLDETIYWSQCARVLRDQQSLAMAQIAHLRRRCLELGVLESDLDRRLDAATAPFEAVGFGHLAAAGWYADPAGSRGFRYWTGTAWTDKVR